MAVNKPHTLPPLLLGTHKKTLPLPPTNAEFLLLFLRGRGFKVGWEEEEEDQEEECGVEEWQLRSPPIRKTGPTVFTLFLPNFFTKKGGEGNPRSFSLVFYGWVAALLLLLLYQQWAEKEGEGEGKRERGEGGWVQQQKSKVAIAPPPPFSIGNQLARTTLDSSHRPREHRRGHDTISIRIIVFATAWSLDKKKYC